MTMHAFALEQQPHYRRTNSSTRRPPIAVDVAAKAEHNSPHSCACGGGCPKCESRLSRKASSAADPMATANSPIGTSIGLLIDSSRATTSLPAAARQRLSSIPAATLQRIRIHDDHAAHQAAARLN